MHHAALSPTAPLPAPTRARLAPGIAQGDQLKCRVGVVARAVGARGAALAAPRRGGRGAAPACSERLVGSLLVGTQGRALKSAELHLAVFAWLRSIESIGRGRSRSLAEQAPLGAGQKGGAQHGRGGGGEAEGDDQARVQGGTRVLGGEAGGDGLQHHQEHADGPRCAAQAVVPAGSAASRGGAGSARGARADGAACGAGMFTENESDTINFPEISKEVLEEVSPAHAPLRRFGVTRSVAHSPRLCARSSSTSTTSCATRTSPCRRSSRSSPPWRWSCSWRRSKTSPRHFPRVAFSLRRACAGLTISTPKPACGRGRALLEIAGRYKSPRAARSPLCPQALSLVCVPNTQLSPKLGSASSPQCCLRSSGLPQCPLCARCVGGRGQDAAVVCARK